MRVLAVPAVRVPDDDLVAVRTAPAGRDDTAGGDGLHRGAGGDREVDARVVAAGPGGARLAVGRADARLHGRAEPAPVRGLGLVRLLGRLLFRLSLGLRCLLLRCLLLGLLWGMLLGCLPLRLGRRLLLAGHLDAEDQLLAGEDQVGVAADDGAVLRVQTLPAADDVLGVRDLGEGVAAGHGVALTVRGHGGRRDLAGRGLPLAVRL